MTYHQVVATRLPVYTIADMRDAGGRIVHYERLLLPFSSDGAAVERILASLETVSPDGAFERRDLMKALAQAARLRALHDDPALSLCADLVSI